MKVAIRHFTCSGHTKKLVDAISEAIGVEALDISHPIAEPVDILFLGNSVYVTKTGRVRRGCDQLLGRVGIAGGSRKEKRLRVEARLCRGGVGVHARV